MPDETEVKWTGVTIGLKEFLAGIVFVITVSGVYYKIYYQQNADKIQTEAEIQELKNKLEAVEKQVGSQGVELRKLQDESISRSALERASSVPYTQMKRVK